jgi:hypothetical protein
MEGSTNNVEKQLRAYAATRRRQAGEPFALPPEVRQTLRAEVDRRYGAAVQSQARQRPWESLFPHLGWIAATVGLLLISAIAVWQGNRPVTNRGERELAQTRLPAERQPADRLPPADEPAAPSGDAPPAPANGRVGLPLAEPAPSSAMTSTAAFEPEAPTPAPARADRAAPEDLADHVPALAAAGPRARSTDADTTDPDTPATDQPSAPFTTTQPAATLSAPRPETASSLAQADAVRPTPMLPPDRDSPVADSTLAPNGAAELARTLEERPLASQRYVRAPAWQDLRRNFNSPPRPEVLREFRVEQLRDRLQITDHDGSIYIANILDPAKAVTSRQEPRAVAPARPGGLRSRFASQAPTAAPSTPAANELLLNAVGTNRTLSQRVEFDGRLVLTNLDFDPPRPTATEQQSLGIWLDNSIIRGSATVGERTRLNIHAAPEKD